MSLVVRMPSAVKMAFGAVEMGSLTIIVMARPREPMLLKGWMEGWPSMAG